MTKQFTTHDGIVFKRKVFEKGGIVVGIEVTIFGYTHLKGSK